MTPGAPVSFEPRGLWAGNVGFGGTQRSSTVTGQRTESEVGSGLSSPDASKGFSSEEQRAIQRLRQTDRAVRAHEQAHLSVGAELVRGGPSYSYEIGPDGKRYAAGGEVSVDASPGKTPEETIPKAQRVRAAALAPADPSAQDYRVAAAASQMEIEARMALARQRSEEIRSGGTGADGLASASSYRQSQVGDDTDDRIGGFLDTFA
ncbi:MAG: putative metalloprotease CJM1_0395 family protein [Propionivibrio sp.]